MSAPVEFHVHFICEITVCHYLIYSLSERQVARTQTDPDHYTNIGGHLIPVRKESSSYQI